MNMRDATSGELVWASSNWGDDMFDKELQENIPRKILDCRAVSREIHFSSAQKIDKFRLEQRVYFRGSCIEEWFFVFGYVIPGSTNTWQQVIAAASKDKMLTADVLSGQVTFETSFFDGDLFICKNLVRVYYV